MTKVAQKTLPADEVDLGSIIDKCVLDAKGRNAEASVMLENLGNADHRIYRAIMNESYSDRCAFLISRKIQAHNRSIRESQARARAISIVPIRGQTVSNTSTSIGKQKSISDVHAEVASRKVAVSLLETYVHGMGKLGDLTQTQVYFAADQEEKMHREARTKSRFYRSIADAMHPGQIVRQVFTNEKADDLYAESAK